MTSSCIVCNHSDLQQKLRLQDQYGDNYTLVRCKNCATHFLDPFPTNEQLTKAYANDYYGEGSKKFSPLVEKVLDRFRSRKAKKFSKYINRDASVLDIGCADGEFLHQLAPFGEFQLHGLEIEGKAAQRAKERGGFELHIGELQEQTYAQDQFDAVSIIHVFEHLADPAKTVEILSSIVKKGGVLFIEQPNIESWQAKLFKDKWLHLDPPRHLNLMGPKSLQQLLQKHGFELINTSFFSPHMSPFGVQQSILNLLFKKRELLYEHLKGNREYTKGYSSLNLLLQKLFHYFTFPLYVMTDLLASLFNAGGTMTMVFRKEEST